MSFVVGTAGHIDHGKSTLVRALTGIDPDRLKEEQERGMTIDLGFARFMRNMLAGAHGLDAVLLVVAADEGVMPQTREHLEILDLLDVRRGIVVLTKTDLVDDEWLQLVEQEVRSALARSPLHEAVVVRVSAPERRGLDDLLQALDRLLDTAVERADTGRARMPIDRVFTMSGFGTVVTGTLVEGSLAAGEEMELMPGRRAVRVRGLQRHGEKVERAGPGSRVAANLGGVDKGEVSRGDVLAAPGSVGAVHRADARVRVLGSAPYPLRHGAEMLLHTGTVEVACRVIVLEQAELAPGEQGWVQLYLERPVAAAAGDRFVLRAASPPATIAGGTLVDVAPRKHARHDSAAVESLARRAEGNVLEEELRKYPRGVTVAALLKATTAAGADVASLRARRAGEWLFSEEAWRAIADRAGGELSAYHASFPFRQGMPREELRSKLGVQPSSFAAVVQALVDEGRVVESNGSLAAPGHEVAIDAAGGPAAELVRVLRSAGFAPPSLGEAMREAGATDEIVRALAARGDIVRVSDDVAFAREAYDAAAELVRVMVREEGSVTVARLRDRMGASRRPVLALLEHLDAQRITRRVGDARTLR